VIWRESRFNPAAVANARSGELAQGTGQFFMPGAAAERRLLDPFDPVEAAAEVGSVLEGAARQFSNLGLANDFVDK
jgi:hypothetical protein